MPKNISGWGKRARDQRSSDMNSTSRQYWMSRGLEPPNSSSFSGISNGEDDLTELPNETKVDICSVCKKEVTIERTVKVRREAMSVLPGPDEFVKKRICIKCDKVACAGCHKKTASSSVKGFIGTESSDKRYTPIGIEPWIQHPVQLKIPGPDQKMLYYCETCLRKHSVEILLERIKKKHRRTVKTYSSDDYWDPDD